MGKAYVNLLNPVIGSVLVGLLAISGCRGDFADVKATSRQPIQALGSGTGCVKTALDNLQSFFEGAGSNERIDQTWNCAEDTLKTFRKFVQGSQSSRSFKATELRFFVEQVSGLIISDRLLNASMKLKQALLGGGQEDLTWAELDRTIEFMELLRSEMKAVSPHTDTLFFKRPADHPYENITAVHEAETQLNLTAQKLGSFLKGSGATYGVTDFNFLLEELDRLYAKQGLRQWIGPAWLKDFIPAFKAMKSKLISGQEDEIGAAEWLSLLRAAAQIDQIYLDIHYLLDPTPLLTTGYGLVELNRTAATTFDLFERVLREKPEHEITKFEIKKVGKELYRMKVLTFPMSLSTALGLLHPILDLVYRPARGGVRPTGSGIDAGVLAQMRADYEGWAEMQTAFDQILAERWLATGVSRPLGRSSGSILGPSLRELRALWAAKSFKNLRHAEEISRLINQELPLLFNKLGTVSFDAGVVNEEVDQEGFTSLNWKRLLISVVIRAYSADAETRRWTGITKAEFKDFYFDLRPLGIDLNFLDPRSTTMWDSTFDEANIFMFSSQPGGHLSYTTGVELVSYALSGGRKSRRTFKALRTSCPNYGPDVFNLPMLETSCYREKFRTGFFNYYLDLPNWTALAKTWDENAWSEFQIAIEKAARVHGYSEAKMESADIDKTSAILQYIEGLYRRFDLDGSGTLNVRESLRALPLFSEVLRDASGLTDPEDIEALYTYLLNYGAPPGDIWDKAQFFLWKKSKSSWSYEVDRLRVLKIVVAIVDQKSKAKKHTP